MSAAVGPVPRAPEHRNPHHSDEGELGQDDGELPEVRKLLEDPLHRDSLPFLCLWQREEVRQVTPGWLSEQGTFAQCRIDAVCWRSPKSSGPSG